MAVVADFSPIKIIAQLFYLSRGTDGGFWNGGDPWSLQMMLGHATLEMVKNFLALANADLQKNHRIALPVDHWRL